MPKELIPWTCSKKECGAKNTYSRYIHQQRVDVIEMKVPIRKSVQVTCRKCGSQQMIEYLEP